MRNIIIIIFSIFLTISLLITLYGFNIILSRKEIIDIEPDLSKIDYVAEFEEIRKKIEIQEEIIIAQVTYGFELDITKDNGMALITKLGYDINTKVNNMIINKQLHIDVQNSSFYLTKGRTINIYELGDYYVSVEKFMEILNNIDLNLFINKTFRDYKNQTIRLEAFLPEGYEISTNFKQGELIGETSAKEYKEGEEHKFVPLFYHDKTYLINSKNVEEIKYDQKYILQSEAIMFSIIPYIESNIEQEFQVKDTIYVIYEIDE